MSKPFEIRVDYTVTTPHAEIRTVTSADDIVRFLKELENRSPHYAPVHIKSVIHFNPNEESK